MATGNSVNLPREHRTHITRPVVVIVVVVVLVIAATVAIWVPVARSRTVVFYADGQPVTEEHVTAMITDLPFDPTSNYYQARIQLLDPTDPKAQYLTTGLKTEAIQRLIVMHAQATEAAKVGITVSSSDLDTAVQTYVKEHARAEDTSELEGLESPGMRSYIELRAISKAYEDNLTKDTTVSEDEVQRYFVTWGWKYKDAQGKQLTFTQAHQQLTNDALENKKFQLILETRSQMLKKASVLVSGDTRYKQFMRWWDIMFGIQVPDSLQPLRVDASS